MNRTSPPVPLNPNPILWINLSTLKTSGNTAAWKIRLRLRSATAGSHCCYTQPAFPTKQISVLHLLVVVFANILHSNIFFLVQLSESSIALGNSVRQSTLAALIPKT